MTGCILENMSGRKLGILGASLLLAQIVFFLIGGLKAPAPANVQSILATKCFDRGPQEHQIVEPWFYPRGLGGCSQIHNFDDSSIQDRHITANDIIFSFQIPSIRGNKQLDMSRWFQNIVAVLHPDILWKKNQEVGKKAQITLHVRLGYRNKYDNETDWREIGRAVERRTLDCKIDENNKKDGHQYSCALLPLFELGSCHYDFYLLNIRIPVDDDEHINTDVGVLHDLWLAAIHQNGGFTKIWFSMKTILFVVIIMIMVWYWRRICLLPRAPNLMEKTLFALGVALSQLNLPIEWLTLWLNMPFMLLLTDIRQGIFYAMLLSFWLIFAGEHLMDDVERNGLVVYRKHLTAVCFGCLCLFVFDMSERGVQLTNPFFSIWATEIGTKLALAFIILAGISACVYFLFLCYMIFKVFRNISSKRASLQSVSSARRLYYEGIIYRFKFLMLVTLLCAAVTVISFIVGQVSEGHWKWGDDDKLEYASAFFTGVYGMWNVYVFALIVMYAPSHKYGTSGARPVAQDDDSQEEIEFNQMPSEAASLTAFAKKAAAD